MRTPVYLSSLRESKHAPIDSFGAAGFRFAIMGAGRNCRLYVPSRSPANVEGVLSLRLGGVPMPWFVLLNLRPDAKG